MNINEEYINILNSLDGFFVIDKNQKIIFMCEALYKLIGYSNLEEVIGQNIKDVLHHTMVDNALKGKSSKSCNFYLSEGHFIVSKSKPIFNQKGEIIGALEYDLFDDAKQVYDFIEQLNTTKGIEHYSINQTNEKSTKYSLLSIKGSSAMMNDVRQEVGFAAKTNSTVLITGETGTGKELVAQSIHDSSQRKPFNFIKVNCAAFPSELFESEVFGYEEGSFTGAKKGGKLGLAEAANRGTLFFDEIDSLPIYLQAKLLRFIQEKEVMRIGSNKPIPVDVRIIAASNKNLEKLVESGDFKNDLYYRLNVIDIHVGALRERIGDIPELANSIIQELNISLGRSVDKHIVKSISNDALKLLMSYDWPGNIRELHNTIEKAMNHCYEETLTIEHFEDLSPKTAFVEDFNLNGNVNSISEIKEKAEIFMIKRVLSQNGMSTGKAAEILGISRQMLHRKRKKYGI